MSRFKSLWKFCRAERVTDLHGKDGLGILFEDNDGRGVESRNGDQKAAHEGKLRLFLLIRETLRELVL